MAFQVSPGVLVKEIDLTNVVPAVATSIGAIASAFEKGPVGSIVNITSEEELIQIFGKPQNIFFQPDSFLKNLYLFYDHTRISGLVHVSIIDQIRI